MKRILQLSLIFLLFLSFKGYSQDRTITGTVTSAESGEGLPGVTVAVKGSTIGTVTDVAGKYAISVPENAATLTFSYVGMVTEEVAIGTKTAIDVNLVPDMKQLGEVVVTGVGVATDRRRVGISVESVNAKELTVLPSATIDQALQGKIPGALIQSVSGQPGQQQNMILRGINTLGTNQPMIMIDGVQINDDNLFNGSTNNFSSRLADIDLSTIERVEVIQGAAAATIYGAQGANGVIQIFTKKGVSGQPTINFSSNVGVNNVLRGNISFPDYHFYNTDEEGFIIDASSNRIALNEFGYFPAPAGGPNTIGGKVDKPWKETRYNQLDQVFKNNALTLNNSISVSGGADKMTYAVSLSNLDQESVIFGKLNRTNGRLNLGFNVTDNFKINIGTSFISSNNTTGGITGQNNVNSPLGSALLTKQYINMNTRDELGNLIGRLENDNSVNPLFSFENVEYGARVTRGIHNINLNYKPTKFLQLDYKYGLDHYVYTYDQKIKNQEDYLRAGRAPFTGSLENRNYLGSTQNSIATAFLTFNLVDDFNSSLPLNFLTQAAFDWRRRTYDRVISRVTGIPAEENINLSRGGNPEIEQFQEEFVTYGYLLNQKVEYKNTVGISGGVRIDWSSAFGAGSTPFVFPRADIYYRLSQHAFWSGVNSRIPEFKLRAAYGKAGVQPGPFDRIPTLGRGSIGGSQPFLMPQVKRTNPNLGVQISTEYEVGADINFSLGNDKFFPSIAFSPVFWTRESDNVIRSIDLPLSTGASGYMENAFTLASSGLQASLDIRVLEQQNFSWNFLTNFSRGITKVENVVNEKDIVLGGSGSGGFVLREGERLGVFFGYTPLRSIDETNSKGVRYIPEGNEGNFELVNGMVVNKTNQSVQFTTEQKVIGDPTPEFNFSFINNFRIGKAFNFSFQIDWVHGFDIYNQTRQWMYRDLLHGDVDQPITINGESAAFSRFYSSQYLTNQNNSQFVEDGSFARLRDVSLSVDASKLTNLKPFRSAILTLSGRNLFTITNYKGMDPEAAANLNDPTQRGLDLYAFPNFKSFNVGLNFGF